MRNPEARRGTTFVEVLVASVLLLVTLGLVALPMLMMQSARAQASSSADLQQEARAVADFILTNARAGWDHVVTATDPTGSNTLAYAPAHGAPPRYVFAIDSSNDAVMIDLASSQTRLIARNIQKLFFQPEFESVSADGTIFWQPYLLPVPDPAADGSNPQDSPTPLRANSLVIISVTSYDPGKYEPPFEHATSFYVRL